MIYIPVSPAIGCGNHHQYRHGSNIVRHCSIKPCALPMFPFRRQVLRSTYGHMLPLSDSFGPSLDDWEKPFDSMHDRRTKCCECQSQILRNETGMSLPRIIPISRRKNKSTENNFASTDQQFGKQGAGAQPCQQPSDSWNETNPIERRADRNDIKYKEATQWSPVPAFDSIFDYIFDLSSSNDDSDQDQLTPPSKSKFIDPHNRESKTQERNSQNREIKDEISSFRKIKGNAKKTNATSSLSEETDRNAEKTNAEEEKHTEELRREKEETSAEIVKVTEKRENGCDNSSDIQNISAAKEKPEGSKVAAVTVAVNEAELLESFDSSHRPFKIDMPITGFSLGDVVIQCDDKRRRLTVSAEREDVDMNNGCVSIRMLRRSFPLPEDVDVDSISSQIAADNDVLTILAERK